MCAPQVAQQTNTDPPDKQYITAPLDVIAGVVEAIGETVTPMLASTDIMTLLGAAVKVLPHARTKKGGRGREAGGGREGVRTSVCCARAYHG